MKPRMDSKRRMLKTGEGVKNKEGQELYYFRWTDEFGKRRYVYSSSLTNLREKKKGYKVIKLMELNIAEIQRSMICIKYG